MEIKRSVFNKLYSEIREPEISILLGARQVGKTTLLHQIEAKAKKDGFSTHYYNLESSEDLAIFSGSNKEIIKKIISSGKVIFIDEFHYLKNASKLFKEIFDLNKKIKIYASGSSSLEIHKHLKESLAGRYRKTNIFPFSLSEFLKIPKSTLKNHFKWGGMPGLIHRKTEDEKMDLLSNIVNTYIIKDIKSLIKEENIRAFNLMLYFLAQNQGSLSVASNISKEAGIAESTVSKYLEIMSQTYVCFLAHSYSKNLANELKKSKKIYLFDIGIRNALLKDFRSIDKREDKGVIYESFTLQHLIYNLKPNMEIRFWRTKKGAEVDFILLVNRQPIPIEVKSKLEKPEIPKGIIAFLKAYPKVQQGFILNEKINKTIIYNNKKIIFLSFDKIDKLIQKIIQSV